MLSNDEFVEKITNEVADALLEEEKSLKDSMEIYSDLAYSFQIMASACADDLRRSK